MGLNIEVGIVADLLVNDEEGAEQFQQEFSALSRYLISIGLQPQVDPRDAEGYYIPQDFERVLIPGEGCPVAGGMVGSSQRLRDECRKIAAVLQLPLELEADDERVFNAAESQGTGAGWERYGRECYSCLRLYHAACHSVSSHAAIVFT